MNTICYVLQLGMHGGRKAFNTTATADSAKEHA